MVKIEKIIKIIFIFKSISGYHNFPNIMIEVAQLFKNRLPLVQHCPNHLWADLTKDWRKGALHPSSLSRTLLHLSANPFFMGDHPQGKRLLRTVIEKVG